MFRAFPILAAPLFGFAATAIADPAPLDGQALAAMMTGASIHLDTPLGTTVPVHYGDNGQVSGEAGSVAFALGSPSDRGRWWVETNRLCHRWNVWFEGDVQCLRLRQDGNRLFWVRDDGKTGTATLVARPQPKPMQVSQQVQTALLTPPGPAQPPILQSAQPKPSAPLLTTPTPAPATSSLKSAPAPRPKAELKPTPKVALPASKPHGTAAMAQSPSGLVPPATRPPIPTYKVAFVEDDDVLNVRTGPSTDYASIGAIAPSAQGVKIMGICEDEWCPIVHRDIMGWVNRYYLVAEPISPIATKSLSGK